MERSLQMRLDDSVQSGAAVLITFNKAMVACWLHMMQSSHQCTQQGFESQKSTHPPQTTAVITHRPERASDHRCGPLLWV